ncbi:MAG: hypothetical protein IT440_15650 [Phycisphaeraceae bacterium]|nr:hypothetical protein [Phycisphaeraceae bacterium]
MPSDKIFSRGMALIAAAHPSLKLPGDIGQAALKMELNYLDDQTFIKACQAVAHSHETPWAFLSAIEQAAAKAMGFLDADGAFNLIGELIENFYMPGLGETSCKIICEKLRERNQPGLVRYFNKFGTEIYNRENPSAVRAQFKKSYESSMQTEMKTFLLEAPARAKELNTGKKLIAASVETIRPEDWQSLREMLPKLEN